MSYRLRQALQALARGAVLALAGFLFMSSLALLGAYAGRTPSPVEAAAIDIVTAQWPSSDESFRSTDVRPAASPTEAR